MNRPTASTKVKYNPAMLNDRRASANTPTAKPGPCGLKVYHVWKVDKFLIFNDGNTSIISSDSGYNIQHLQIASTILL